MSTKAAIAPPKLYFPSALQVIPFATAPAKIPVEILSESTSQPSEVTVVYQYANGSRHETAPQVVHPGTPTTFLIDKPSSPGLVIVSAQGDFGGLIGRPHNLNLVG